MAIVNDDNIMFNVFKNELTTKILPFINKHQTEFVIHGNSHIIRCLIYAKAIIELEQIPIDESLLAFYAISFHDSGRVLDFGEDNNEELNIIMVEKYLYTENKLDRLNKIVDLMSKQNNEILSKIVYDTDVLDIIRPSTGIGGIFNFKIDKLKLLITKPYLNDLLSDVVKLTQLTDNNDLYNKPNLVIYNNLIKENNFRILNGI